MKNILKKVIPEKFHGPVYKLMVKPFKRQYNRSFAQSGEDMILNTILCDIKKGFYVDVGANNPKIQSNTHFFYEKGWHGINIDALPGSMKKFSRVRSRDINLEYPISDREETLEYFMFSSSFYNSFQKEAAEKYKHILIGSKKLMTKKLSWILENFLNNQNIDFLTIDVEGLDLQVLKSNDWTKYRPKVIVLELFANKIESIKKHKINQFLDEKGYLFYCLTPTNIFFLESNFKKTRFDQE